MLIYANLEKDSYAYGKELFKIKDKQMFIPLYKIKNAVLRHMKIKSKVRALAIEFRDMDKVNSIEEYTDIEFRDNKSDINSKYLFIYKTDSSYSEVEGT